MAERQPRTYVINRALATQLVQAAGYTIERLAREPKLRMGKHTIRKVLRGKPVYMSTVVAFAGFFGAEVGELLQPAEAHEDLPLARIGEWEIREALGPVEELPNGLQFRCYRLVHSRQTHLVGRGKRFVLDHLSLAQRAAVQERLLRHTNVCNQVGVHRNLARHLEIKSEAGENLWWVIDQWVEGHSLEDVLAAGPLDACRLPGMMQGIAEGLDILHRGGVVVRQLSPHTVLVEAETGDPVLVDFEMAKLMGRRPTVSPDRRWPDDDYRAPEIGGTSTPDASADAYSWARVLLHACTGEVPPPPDRVGTLLDELDLPRFVKAVLGKCLSIDRRARPNSMQMLISAMKRWRPCRKCP